MLRIEISILAIVSLALVGFAYGQGLGHEERCQILEGSGVRVDQCDSTKYLSCKEGRCLCSDPVNQIYTSRNEIISSRGKRSPGKKGGGGFKKIAVGAVAGAATYHVASQAGKSFSNGFTTTPKPPKYRKVYSCYSRVGGQCALNYNNVESVGSTSTTTAVPAVSTSPEVTTNETTTAASDNATSSTTSTTTGAPVAAALTSADLSKIPKCVQYAMCKPASPSTGNSTAGYLQKVDFDPRVGVCECESGYKNTNKDLCEKESGAGKTAGASMAVILATLIANRMFV